MRNRKHIAAGVGLLLAWVRPSAADGISGLVEGEVTRSVIDTTDQSGARAREDDLFFIQRYRLNLERSLFPSFRVAGGGSFDRLIGNTSLNGISTDVASRTSLLYGNVGITGPIFNALGGYTRREERDAGSSNSLVNEVPELSLGYRPEGLPQFTLRLSRSSIYDQRRELVDILTSQALANVIYVPVREVDLRYTLDVERPEDRLHLTDSTQITNSARAAWSDLVFGGQAAVAAGVSGSDRETRVTSVGPGGTIATQLSPIAGLSLVEAFPAVPQQDTLLQNPALVDGVTNAGAGLNIGFSPAIAGDTNFRDVGLQFQDATQQVTTLWLWVDRQLPANVSTAFAFAAYTSDDNLHWTEIAVGPVAFGLFENRFEIQLAAPSQSRYLKVITRPLAPGITTDSRFSDILVTELQAFLVVAARVTSGWQSQKNAMLNASARVQLFREPLLAYDFAAVLQHVEQGGPSQNTYAFTNGLTASKRLNEVFVLDGRVARQDSDEGRGHIGQFLWSAGVTATPLPTLSHTLVYSGQATFDPAGNSNANTWALYNRVTPYRGIGFLAGFSYTLGLTPQGQTTRSDLVTISATMQPHRALTLTATYGHDDNKSTGAGLPETHTFTNRVEGTATFNPVPALLLSGGASRNVTNAGPFTIGNAAASFSPFPGADLQFAFTFAQTITSDHVLGTTNRIYGPSVRWNIRPGTFLNASYTILDNNTAAQTQHQSVFDVDLKIAI